MDDVDAKAPLAGVAAGLKSAGPAQDAASSLRGHRRQLRQDKAKYLDMLMDLQKQERAKALGAIARFAVQMQAEGHRAARTGGRRGRSHIAVGVLKYVVVILRDVTQFWT